MRGKRGQLTAIIIVGVVILILVGLLFTLKGRNAEQIGKQAESVSEEKLSSSPVKLFIQNCIEKAARDSIVVFGYQGGRINLPYERIPLENYDTSYLYYEGQSMLIPIEGMESELAFYTATEASRCFDDFKSFPGMEFSGNITNVSVRINDNDILFDVDFPLEIKQGDSIESLSGFSTSVDARLPAVYNVAETIVNTSLNVAPFLVDLDYLRSLDMNVSVVAYDNNSIIYIIKDPQTKILEDAYVFVFASKVGPDFTLSTERLSFAILNGVFYADLTGKS